MATVVIKLDGVDITADVVFAQPTNFRSLADGQPGTAVVLIDDEQQAYIPDDIRAGMTLELFIDGQREWDGWAFKVRRAWPLPVDDTSQPVTVPRFWIIEGYDRNILFQKRFMYRIDDPANNEGFTIWPTDTSDKQAIDFALNNYVDLSGDDLDIESGIEQVASPGPFEEFTLGYVSAPLGVLFDDAAKITGAVFYIDPDRVLRYIDDRTVTAPFVLSDAPTAGQVGYREAEAAKDYTDAGNEALIWGAGLGSADPVFAKYTDTDRVALHGLWQYGELYVGAWQQQTVNRRARTYVEGSPSHRRGHNEPVPVVTCSLFTPGIRVGHVVDFRMTTYDYQEALPVRSSTITFLSPTEPRWDFELTLRVDTPFGVPDLWKLKFPPPFDISETIPPEGPGSLPGTATDLLIDHFDQTYDDEYIIATAENTSTGTVHVHDLPEGSSVAGRKLVMFIIHDYTVVGPSNFPMEGKGWTRIGSVQSMGTMWGAVYHKTTTGTEGDTITINTDSAGVPFNAFVHTYITLLWGNTVQGAFQGVSGIPPTLNPTWAEADDTIWFTWTVVGNDPFIQKPVTGLEVHSGSGDDTEGNTLLWSVHRFLDDATTHSWSSSDRYGSLNDGNVVRVWTVAIRGNTPTFYTPGPEITGAPWPGGNPYIFGGSVQIADSELSFLDTAESQQFARLHSNVMYTIDDQTGEITGTPGVAQGDFFSGTLTPPGPWEDLPFDLLVKFRYSQTGTRGGSLYLIPLFIELDPDGVEAQLAPFSTRAAWMSEMRVGLWWNDSDVIFGTDPTVMDIENAASGGTGILPSLQTDPFPDDFEDGVDHKEKSAPWQHRWQRNAPGASSTWPVLAPETDYYFRIRYGGEIHDATAHSLTIRAKYWEVGLAEPSEWTLEDVMPMYKAWADTYLGYPNVTGFGGLTTSYRDLYILATGDAGTVVYVDAMWAYGSGSGVGTIVTDIPIYDNAEHAGAQYYITQYPYAAGSLVVYFQGIRLRPNVDYVETDSTTGEFRILGDRDVSSSLLVKYTRAGSVPTSSGGGVYRPEPQLQYGWGTPMDGYNALFACSAMALDRHTLGANTAFTGTPRNTPPNHRGFQSDQSTGGGLDDVETAWSAGWGETFYGWGIQSWSAFVTHIDARQGAVLQGIYSNLPASKRLSNFTGAHAIYINERFANGNFWGIDPLYRYPTLYTTDELKAYAAGIVIGADTVGYGSVSAGYTKVT